MFGLYDAIKYVQEVGCPVHTIGLGKIMSAGVLLLACGTQGHRQIGENASVMYHLGRAEADGDIFEMRNSMKELERLDKLANDLLATNTNMTVDDIEKMLKERQDVYLTAEQAVELGVADAILGKQEL
jgi:ATP-dependent Clp protease protease subunit